MCCLIGGTWPRDTTNWAEDCLPMAFFQGYVWLAPRTICQTGDETWRKRPAEQAWSCIISGINFLHTLNQLIIWISVQGNHMTIHVEYVANLRHVPSPHHPLWRPEEPSENCGGTTRKSWNVSHNVSVWLVYFHFSTAWCWFFPWIIAHFQKSSTLGCHKIPTTGRSRRYHQAQTSYKHQACQVFPEIDMESNQAFFR